MKFKLVSPLLVLVFCFSILGCTTNNSHNDNEGNEEPETEYYTIHKHLNLFEYKFEDVLGFELGEEFEKLYAEGTLDFGEGCTLTLQSGDLALKLPSNLDQSTETKILSDFDKFAGNAYEWERGTIGTIKDLSYFSTPQVADRLLIGGVKFNKLWFGLFDLTTKEQINEWIDSEIFDRNVTINLGYGKTEEYIIGNHLIADYVDNIYYFNDDEICALIVPYGNKLAFMYNGQLKSVDINVEKEKKEGYMITDWYDSSVLITLSDSRSLLGENPVHYIYKNNGEFVAKFSGNHSGVSSSQWIFLEQYNMHPFNYDEVMEITSNSIKKYKINNESNLAEITWDKPINSFDALSGTLAVTSTLISKTDDYVEMRAKAIEYSGKSIEIHFTVDITNGEIEFIDN